jgi:hypothetical protein
MMASSPGLRAAWRISRDQYDGEFVAFMNKTIADVSNAAPADRYKQWQAALQPEMA